MSDTMQPPAHGTDQRLDVVIDELRAIKALLTPAAEPESDTVELREPAAEKPPAKRKQGKQDDGV